MSERDGFIELERTVDSITIGTRHRTDYGDLSQLIASIKRDGLLQPVTITPDGVLVCGARRLEAIKQLGWRTVNVWVRSGITDRLGALLAEQDDNLLHKPLTPTEQATLYRELKEIMAEEAAQRQAATQFGTEGKQPGQPGAGESPGPYGMKGGLLNVCLSPGFMPPTRRHPSLWPRTRPVSASPADAAVVYGDTSPQSRRQSPV